MDDMKDKAEGAMNDLNMDEVKRFADEHNMSIDEAKEHLMRQKNNDQ